jgi:V8-like Glu-specific endopeptidase
MPRTALLSTAVALAAALITTTAAHADEGMWTYDNFPATKVKQQYGVTIDGAWLDRVREASVRLAGCSASFVSPEGLILTNHHCITACLSENSSKEKSLLDDGFVARSRGEEIPCRTQVADVLVGMENVTDKVEAATRGLDERAANEARKRTLTGLEQACEKDTGLKCQAVALYNGGQQFLYRYKRYTDVRLVFAPETDIAAFGGDPDNFQFPRWCLDMGLLRAYENGKPVKVARPLRINFEGPKAGEFVLVSGHPGSTDRLLTVDQLLALRNDELPPSLLRSNELRGRYIEFAKKGDAERRITADTLFSLENGIKVRRKQLDALLDEGMMSDKRAQEAELRARVAADPSLAGFGNPWADIAAANARARDIDTELGYLEGGAGFQSRLFRIARTLVRGAEERGKPNGERLREFTDAQLPRVQQQLAAATPVYPEVERLTMSFGFERMREWLGPDHAVVRKLLAKDSPDSLAASLVDGSKLGDPAVRLALWNGGSAAIAASDDPMIKLAREVDAPARALRKRYEDEVQAPIAAAEEKIARARFKVYGTEVYPDATFTLRLNYGTVQGWVEKGSPVEPFTRLGRAFERATGQPPFNIPASWERARGKLDLATPFNLTSNNDIIGGNSGSPLLNARGEVVGLIFDGNIHSISGSFWFDTAKNRAVAVHPAIMREALRKVYDAPALLKELGDK